MHAHDNPIDDPSAWNCSRIWNASSRVGVKTKTDSLDSPGASSSVCRTVRARNLLICLFPAYTEPQETNSKYIMYVHKFTARSKQYELFVAALNSNVVHSSNLCRFSDYPLDFSVSHV